MNYDYEISVVVPVYNSQDSLKLLYERISRTLKQIKWQLVLVNDASKDESWKIIKQLQKENKNITAINLMNNFGQQNATVAGLNFSKGRYTVIMDDDLQHPPEEIFKLYNKIKENDYRVVYGQYKQKNHGWFRDLCSKIVNSILSKVAGTGYNVTSFKILEKKVVDELKKFNNYNFMIDVFIKDIVNPRYVGHCKVRHEQRKIGKSNYSFKKLASYALNMIFNYTLWPLRIATLLGFCVSTISILLAIAELINYFVNGIDVRGWTSLFLVISLIFGILLFIVGIFGEYLGKIYLILNKKPQFIVKEIKGD
jgi:glycosyltransferase involved in cell wall biosynthesis